MVCLVDSKKLPAACKSLHFIQGQVMVLSKFLATTYLFNQCILLTVHLAYDYIIQVLLIQSFCWLPLWCIGYDLLVTINFMNVPLLVLLTLPPLTTSCRQSLTCKVWEVRGCLSQLMGNHEQIGRLCFPHSLPVTAFKVSSFLQVHAGSIVWLSLTQQYHNFQSELWVSKSGQNQVKDLVSNKIV